MRFAAVRIGLLASKIGLTGRLFEERQENLLQIIDRINSKHGDYTVFPTEMLSGQIIRPEVNGYLGDKYFRLVSR